MGKLSSEALAKEDVLPTIENHGAMMTRRTKTMVGNELPTLHG